MSNVGHSWNGLHMFVQGGDAEGLFLNPLLLGTTLSVGIQPIRGRANLALRLNGLRDKAQGTETATWPDDELISTLMLLCF